MTNNNEELNQAEQEQNQSLEQTPNLAEGTIENNLEETKELDPRENSEESVNSTSEEDNVETVTNGNDDFDWSMNKDGFATYTDTERKNLEALYSTTFKQVEENTLVEGIISSITDKEVVVNIGYKSDGIISKQEFRDDEEEPEVGQKVEVFVLTKEDEMGQLILSKKRASLESIWENVVRAMEEGEVVSGRIQTRTKGGLVVDLMGMEAFLPGSQIDVKPIRDYDQYVGQNMQFKIVKVNDEFKNVVVSHKALIEDDIEAQKSEILNSLEKGQVLEGIVKNMTNFGVFVDLGGLDGLLHITDVSWRRISHPEEVLSLDEKINVVVLDFDDDKNRISLGLKQLQSHPWDALSDNIKEGSKLKGKVVTVSDYGAFVEVEPGIEGLVHVSEMSWSQHLRNPQDFLKEGDQIEVVVLSIDKEVYKMSLGMKQLTSDPWAKIETKYPLNSKHKGTVRSLTNYGLFIELEEGVDGLVHVSDLSWSKKIKHPAEFTKKGEELEVVVLEIDSENRRLSLGHKQIDENPWDTYETVFALGTDHSGTILSILDRGCTVQLPYDVEAFAPGKHAKKPDKSALSKGEVAQFRIIEFNKSQKRIIVSHTDIWKEEERAKEDADSVEKQKRAAKTAKAVNKINDSAEKSTLGELDALSALKQKMEKAAKDELTKIQEQKEAEKQAKAKEREEKKQKVKQAPEPVVPARDPLEGLSDEEITKQLLGIIGQAAESSKENLTQMDGIGPAYQKKLNALGIFTFQQFSKLDEKSIQMLEKLTKWKGRVSRDNWIDQAKEILEKSNSQ